MVMRELALDKLALAAVSREFNLTLILLFGSQATGHVHAQSDTDIGIYRKSGRLTYGEFKALYTLSRSPYA